MSSSTPLDPIGQVPSGFDPAAAAHAGDFVNACYLMYGDGNVTLEPPPNGIPFGYTIHDYIVMSDFLITGRRIQAFYGFIATNADGSDSVVAMRGTIGSTEWIDNLLFVGFMPFVVDGKRLGDVHKGFGTIYQSISVIPADLPATAAIAPDLRPFSDKVAAAIAAHRSAKGLPAAPARITVAAHSLGAALLTLYVLENETKRSLDQVVAYAFASPRVGDQTFVDSYNELEGAKTYRIFKKKTWFLICRLTSGAIDTSTLPSSIASRVLASSTRSRAITRSPHIFIRFLRPVAPSGPAKLKRCRSLLLHSTDSFPSSTGSAVLILANRSAHPHSMVKPRFILFLR